jgi:hypothetical protein
VWIIALLKQKYDKHGRKGKIGSPDLQQAKKLNTQEIWRFTHGNLVEERVLVELLDLNIGVDGRGGLVNSLSVLELVVSSNLREELLVGHCVLRR